MKKKQFLVIGAGRFGSSLARTVYDLGHDVMVIDTDEVRVQLISQEVNHAVRCDTSSEESLRALGVGDFDVVVVAIGQDIQASIMTSILLKELGAGFVVAKANSELHGKVLTKIGVDRVVFPERDMGQKVAHSLIFENIVDLIELSPDYSIVEVLAPGDFAGRSIQGVDLRAKYGVNMIAIRNRQGVTNISPMASDIIQEGDILVVIGENKALKKLGWI